MVEYLDWEMFVENSFAKKFDMKRLMLFAMPSITMMMFLSAYIIVDVAVVSKFVGAVALSSLNMVYPITSMQLAIAITIATGGSAIIAKNLGEGNKVKAREYFTFLVFVESFIDLLFVVFGNLFINNILDF